MSTNKKDEPKDPLKDIQEQVTQLQSDILRLQTITDEITDGKRADFARQLMQFRTTYIKAVARASVDSKFRADLTGFTEKGEPNASKVLTNDLGYTCPWPLTLVLHDNILRGPRLNPADGRVMTLPYWGESITVYIPRKPSGDAKVQLDALAAYYHQNPWFLQPELSNGVDYNAGELSANIRNPPPVFEKKWSSVKSGRYDLGANIDNFISFAAAIFNAVSLAWENEVMWNELTAYKGQPDWPRARTIGILNEWLGYNYPWELDLFIQPDESATYTLDLNAPEKPGQWKKSTQPVLMLTLPWMSGVDAQFPELTQEMTEQEIEELIQRKTTEAAMKEVAQNQKNPGVAIMGLALYNTDGPGYPFTCG